MNTILVSSHRRSGTHFLIDSLRKNIQAANFPNHARLPADFNLGSLFSKKEQIYDIFTKLIDSPGPSIIKSHLLPEECNIGSPRDKHEELIKEIFVQSKKLYISRDGKDVLISLYKYLKPVCSFSDFIRQQNDHIVKEIRSFQVYDSNRVSYWSYHINQWQGIDSVKYLSFDALMNDFQETIHDILTTLGYDIPTLIEKPHIPKYLFWHAIQKKMNHFGLARLPESSSVRPNKGSKTSGALHFSESDLEFFLKYKLVTL